jgi:glycosyltransferase involved in cell wall biosynthesis
MRLMFAARAIDRMAGGVERMIIAVMNAMAARGHQVDLFTWDEADAEAFYPMASGISWHRLDMGDPQIKAGAQLILRRAKTFRAIVRRVRPQAIICFQHGPYLALRLYTLGLGIPLIAAERNAPTQFEHTRAGRIRRFVAFNSFRFARALIVQSEGCRKLYPVFLRDRIITIPNPVFPAPVMAQPDCADQEARFHILSVGRLSYQKNYTSLISAFVRVAVMFPEWDLVIVGEGEQRQDLESMIAQSGLVGRIKLPGTVTDTSRYYGKAHLFCLPSRWEGFPNALAEALAHGLPSIGYAGCAGTNELIEDGRTGLLAAGNGDAKSLADVLTLLMRDHERRRRMGAAGRESMQSFATDVIFDAWESTLERIK